MGRLACHTCTVVQAFPDHDDHGHTIHTCARMQPLDISACDSQHARLTQAWLEKSQDMRRAVLGVTDVRVTNAVAEYARLARLDAPHGSKQAALDLLNKHWAEVKGAAEGASEGAAFQVQQHVLCYETALRDDKAECKP